MTGIQSYTLNKSILFIILTPLAVGRNTWLRAFFRLIGNFDFSERKKKRMSVEHMLDKTKKGYICLRITGISED